MVKLYYCPRTRSVRILWLLEELGIPFDVEEIDVRSEHEKADAEFRQASPMGKVPAIVDGDVKISETAAIALYLADKYSPGVLAPLLSDPMRGKYLYWMIYTPAIIEPSMAEKFNDWPKNPSQHGWGDFEQMIQTLEDALKDQDWLLGDNFSAADVIVGSSCYFLKMFGILPHSEPIEAYIHRCLQRPAYQRALARDTA